MKTAVFANYKPTDTLSASGFMAGLIHGCGLICEEGLYTNILLTQFPSQVVLAMSLVTSSENTIFKLYI